MNTLYHALWVSFFSTFLHLIRISSSFRKSKAFSAFDWQFFMTFCCVNTNDKCSAYLHSLLVTYSSTTFSAQWKLFFNLLINLRTKIVTLSKRLQLVDVILYKIVNFISIMLLRLVEHSSLEHFLLPQANRQNWNDPSACSTRQLFCPVLSNYIYYTRTYSEIKSPHVKISAGLFPE